MLALNAGPDRDSLFCFHSAPLDPCLRFLLLPDGSSKVPKPQAPSLANPDHRNATRGDMPGMSSVDPVSRAQDSGNLGWLDSVCLCEFWWLHVPAICFFTYDICVPPRLQGFMHE